MGSILAVDVGGTTIRAVEADRSGLVGEPLELPTDSVDSAAGLADELAGGFEDVDAIGVAAAGVVDRERKEFVRVANWEGWSLRPLEAAFDAPLALENDADASALGTVNYGDAAIPSDFAYLNIGTGVGIGVVRDGELVPGVEAGFLNLGWDGSVRHAGVNNPWEGYVSGNCLPDRLREWLAEEQRGTVLSDRPDAQEFFEAVYAGDRVGAEYYTRLKRINAAAIGTVSDLFGTELVVVGGGVARAHPNLVDYEEDPHAVEPVDIDDYTITEKPAVELTEFGEDTELYGAAAAAVEAVDE